MKPDKYVLRLLTFPVLVFLILMPILLHFSKPQLSEGQFENTIIKQGELISDRQFITIKADSLRTFLNERKPFIKISEGFGSIGFYASGSDKKSFDQLFFNGDSDFYELQNHGLDFDDYPYGFKVDVFLENNTEYVTLPAEIVQSILLNS